MSRLPMVRLDDGAMYYVDGQLRQLRQVDNPHEFRDFETVEALSAYIVPFITKPGESSVVHRCDDKTPGAWEAFIKAMRSGQRFECDEDMAYYWLEVLPPVFMGRRVKLPSGELVNAWFGFAEGEEPITVFWKNALGDRFFGCRTELIAKGR